MAILFLILGLFIWKKQRISLIHSYHPSKVSEEDKKDYTEEMGKSLILIALGLILDSIMEFITEIYYGWMFFIVFFVLTLIKMTKAQRKYNEGWF